MQGVGAIEEAGRGRIVGVGCLGFALKGVWEVWLAVAIRSFGEERPSLVGRVGDVILPRVWKELYRCQLHASSFKQ